MPARCAMVTATLVLFLTACDGPEQRKMEFYQKGKRLLEQGDLVKAALELKNAVQIDPKFAEGYYQLGLLEWRRGAYPGAFEWFGKAVQASPGHLEAQVMLGRLYLLTGERGRALAQERADLVLKTAPRHGGALLLRGAVLMARQEWDRAAELFEWLTGQKESQPEAYQLLALARANRQDPAGAEAALLQGAQRHPTSVALRKSLAEFYASRGSVAQAEVNIRQMMELDPANYGYGITLAALYLDAGRTAEGAQLLGRILSDNRKNQECLLDLARFRLARGEAAQAEQLLRQGISTLPESLRLRLMLGELLAGTDRGEQGMALIREYLEREQKGAGAELLEARNLLARLHLMRGELPEAESCLAEVFKVSPRDGEATFLKGLIALRRKDGPRAVSAFRTLVSDRPEDLQGYLLLAEAHLVNGEPKLAQESLTQAERLEPDSLAVVRAQARLSFLQKEHRRGAEGVARYLSRHPDARELLLESGDLYRRAGDFARAATQYQSAQLRDPSWTLPYLRLGELYLDQGNPRRGLAELERGARVLDRDDLQAALGLARLYIRAGALPKARRLYREFWKRHPESWQLANDYACFLTDQGGSPADLELACSLAGAAAGQRPEDPSVLDTLGWSEYRRGNYQKAVELLEKSRGKRPGHQIANYHLGMAYLGAGQKELARACLTRAVSGGGFPGKAEALAALQLL